jgi:hypothetical protein
MACDKNTCKTCNQLAKFRSFKKLLPASVRDSFENWFNDIYQELEVAQLDLASTKLEWRQDHPRFGDESEERYQLRLKEWEQYKREREGISNG